LVVSHVSTHRQQLRVVSSYLSKRHNRWFAAAEQGGLSACNFLFSLIVLKYSGIAVLGEYGFWFSLGQASSMIATGFAINQMVLHVAGSSVVRQREVMGITVGVVIFLQVLPGVLLWWVATVRYAEAFSVSLALSIICYTATFNLAELTRQFLYMRNRHRLSLLHATTSLSLSVITFGVIVVLIKPHSALAAAFWCLTLAQGGYVLSAVMASRAWRFASLPSRKQASETIGFYWTHGRFAAAGVTVTWAQNKSVTPVLALTMGNVAAGVYQIARMIITPINVITLGLARSALAQIRRAWGDGDEQSLNAAIREQLRSSMIVVFCYLAVAYAILIFMHSTEYVVLPDQLFLIFVATTLVVVLSNYRYWMSRRFAVQLQFSFLLKTGCVAAVLALLWMAASGMLVESAALVVLGSAVGELYLIEVLKRGPRVLRST